MKLVVTGAAGFVGSHLTERLLALGNEVIGIDSMEGVYPREIKRNNLGAALEHSHFTFCEGNLLDLPLEEILDGVDTIYHLAARPGVRFSWGRHFGDYVRNNLEATQRLLEASISLASPPAFIYASTSAVYGNTPVPMREDGPVRPVSPYGVTKLAAEQLFHLYGFNFGVRYTILRLFSVYGPRQRPDMSFFKFMHALTTGRPLVVFGDGSQARDFTFVDDIVEGSLRALNRPPRAQIFNLGGGNRVSLGEAIKILGEITGIKPQLQYVDQRPGDASETWADISRARALLDFQPSWGLADGLRAQWEWFCRQFQGKSGRREGSFEFISPPRNR